MRILGLIPARAGSKGIKNKNLVPFCGKSLVEHSMKIADDAHNEMLLVDYCVSSDCPGVLDAAWKTPAFCIKRPPEIATDDSPVIETVRHALGCMDVGDIDAVLLLQPTNPLRNLDDIRGAIALLEAHPEADSVISHIPARCHPARMRYLGAGLYYGARVPLAAKAEFSEATQGTARQQLPPVIQRTGEIYLTRTKQIREGNDMEGTFCVPWMQDPARAWDIDEPVDLVIAEALWKAANQHGLESGTR